MSDEIDELIKSALNNTEIPHIYFNGFAVSITPSDVILVVKRGESPIGLLYMSHNIAKTIVDLLGRTLVTYETTTGFTIPTTLEIAAKLGKEDSTNDQ